MGYANRKAQHRTMYPVPVAPVLRHVERWLERYQRENDCDIRAVNAKTTQGELAPLTAIQALAERCGTSGPSMVRSLYRMRRESARMQLAVADRLLTATYGPHVWREDKELRGVMERLEKLYEGEGRLTEEEIREWARGEVEAMTPEQRASIAALEPGDFDHSTFARHRKAKAA